MFKNLFSNCVNVDEMEMKTIKVYFFSYAFQS